MTTPTDQAPGIYQLPAPCWTVRTADGEGAGFEGAEFHSTTREEAEKDRDGYTDRDTGENTTVVVQLHESCWAGTLLCGEPFVYHGDMDQQHFADMADLLDAAQQEGCLLTPDSRLTCGEDTDCEECTPLRRDLKQQYAMRDTHPDVFTRGVAEGWADPETDPTRIDWTSRRAGAHLFFWVRDGRPVNPWGQHLPYGRGQLGHWGPKANADAIVFATCQGHRYLLMGERDDGHGWAIPGGGVDPGETAQQAAVRELFEETGLRLPAELADTVQMRTARYVPDPRASREAWMITVPYVFDLGEDGRLPDVAGSSDLIRAMWMPADTVEQLRAAVEHEGGTVFPAHEKLLDDAIEGKLS